MCFFNTLHPRVTIRPVTLLVQGLYFHLRDGLCEVFPDPDLCTAVLLPGKLSFPLNSRLMSQPGLSMSVTSSQSAVLAIPLGLPSFSAARSSCVFS